MEAKMVAYVQQQLDMSGDDSMYLDCHDSEVARIRAALEAAGHKVAVRRNNPCWLEVFSK